MAAGDGFLSRTAQAGGRSFSIRVQRFENGFFVSVSEGAERLGSLVASMASSSAPVTTTVIPARSDSLFLKLVAEQISSRVRGIALVSASTGPELGPAVAKALMSEIMDMVCDE